MRGGSDGRRGVGLSGADPGHVFQLAGVGHVVARLVLGQDFHQRTQLQPPLLLRDPVAEEAKHEDERFMRHCSSRNKRRCIILIFTAEIHLDPLMKCEISGYFAPYNVFNTVFGLIVK